jgi:RNA polymerase sigma-70 factor (ECF subfamily)
LLKAYEGLSDLRDPGALRTWLFRVAANACRMRRRKVGSREVPLEDHFSVGGRDTDGSSGIEVPDVSHLPDNEAARAELHRAIEKALHRLPVEQRLVVLLRDVEGLDTRDTAAALSISESAVKMRLHRARATLRHELSKNFAIS